MLLEIAVAHSCGHVDFHARGHSESYHDYTILAFCDVFIRELPQGDRQTQQRDLIRNNVRKLLCTNLQEKKMFRRTFLAMTAATLIIAPAFAGSHSKDIVDTAVGAGNFNTLVAAVEAAGLVDTLKGEGPFTVFAPTDAAFEALPEGTVENLLKPENKDKLVSILTYHVVSGKVMSGDLSEGMEAATVQGDNIMITLEGGPKINGAMISAPDIEASNGVIHVIDAVIMPSN